uniref:Uncharacterized protein n=1 Tax=Haptolina ericina TaxID=156174 RepID=A0A7S3AIN3_9EUKA|mmetsp:Transcript_20712/g.46348  ORF Transcript_20712/g.46348 Transcript_20712/m.46348 type:complete len:111 (+) Transcript_20712:455-787(+)
MHSLCISHQLKSRAIGLATHPHKLFSTYPELFSDPSRLHPVPPHHKPKSPHGTCPSIPSRPQADLLRVNSSPPPLSGGFGRKHVNIHAAVPPIITNRQKSSIGGWSKKLM